MNTHLKRQMKQKGWGVVKTSMTIHDVPFKTNPIEVVPKEHELEMLRKNFDNWMTNQGSLPNV